MRQPLQPVPFGAEERRGNLERLASDTFDVLVVGGGITGAAVARDVALRGLHVGLVEKGDYASGTSSRSSQLIHGGLRYLEHFDFGLVFEALRERQILIRTAPHLISPQTFLFPAYRGDRTGPWRMRLGLAAYDILAGFRSIGRHKRIRLRDVATVEPGLRTSGLRALASYFDATTNDARLTLAVLRSAAAAGALAVNYTKVIGLRCSDGGRVSGARARDELSGSEFEIRARVIANAGGVWAGEIFELTGSPRPGLVRPSKGSHLVLEQERLPVRNALIFESPIDHRIMFVIPWGGFTLVGTTEVEFDGPADEVGSSPAEVAYLLESVGKVLPHAGPTPADVCGTYAGLRPLVAEGDLPTGATSREHAIMEAPANLFTIAGGKLTTHRLMAEQLGDLVVKRLARDFGVEPRERCLTRVTPLSGAPARKQLSAMIAVATSEARRLGLPEDTGAHLVRRYGSEFREILRRIELDSNLGELLVPHHLYTAAEALFSAEMEMAQTVTDFMTRRTHLVYAGGAKHHDVAERAARSLAAAHHWGDDELRRQVKAYDAEREKRRSPLTGAGAGPHS